MRRHPWLEVLSLSMVLLSLAGCGGAEETLDTGSAATTDTRVDPPLDTRDPSLDARDEPDAPGAEATRTTIGAGGGTARSADGLFEILVAPGALTEDTEIAITPVAPSEVPADIAATDPISVVYSVEPDGLTFGGDGAIARFLFDTVPAGLVTGEEHLALLGATRPSSGGPIEREGPASTLYTAAGGLVTDVSIAHLSFKWAFSRSERGERYAMGTLVGASTQVVGTTWTWTVIAEGERAYAGLHAQAWSHAPGVVSVQTPSSWTSGSVTLLAPSILALPWETGGIDLPAPMRVMVPPPAGFPAGEPQPIRPGPTFRCDARGTTTTAAGVHFYEASPDPVASIVVEQDIECLEAPAVEVSILDTIPAFRDDLAILTDTAPLTEVRVETRGGGTRTVNLAASPWYAILEPRAAPMPIGPPTITATNEGGATMTATRDDTTGEYTALLDDPSLWDADASTGVVFGAAPRREVGSVPRFGASFGPVNGLDTPMTLEADTRLAIRIPGELSCGAEQLLDPVLFRSIVEDFPLEGALREALSLLADHCEQTIEALTGRPFTVEVSRRANVLEVMPDYGASVDVGRAITIDGQALLTECGGRFSMFCTDRCIDPLLDPMNCGGCGRVGVEVCNDDVDNDCDSTRDEGCPTGIDWFGGGDSDASSMIGDTTSASSGNLGHGCTYFTPFTGLCGTTNTDGTVRGLSTICGAVSLVPTGLDAFEVRVTESHPGGIACEMAAFTPSGGTLVAARCPPNMIADGVQGVAPSSGNLGQVSVTCSQWDVVRDPALGWVIRRIATGSSPTVGSGPGMPFPSFMLRDHTTLGTPGALRQLRGRYGPGASGMPAGVLWFSVAGSPPMLRIP